MARVAGAAVSVTSWTSAQPRVDAVRVLTAGAVTDSEGGLYNPGAWASGNTILAIVRRERLFPPTGPSHDPVLCSYVRGLLLPEATVAIHGYGEYARLEDFRPFRWRDQALLVTHTRLFNGVAKPVISTTTGAFDLVRYDDWNLPIATAPIEKNWGLGETAAGELFTVYQISPLLVYVLRDGRWRAYREGPPSCDGLARTLGKAPSNSTHLIPFRGGYLGWWHTILMQSYLTGAYWISATFDDLRWTPPVFDGAWWAPQGVGGARLNKPHVWYVSSQVVSPVDADTLLLFIGEGDTHSCVARVSLETLAVALGLPE